MQNPRTARDWPLPHVNNKLSEDNPRLVETLHAIDGDITDLEARASALETSASSHASQLATHGGQIAALAAKTATDDPSLDSLQEAADRIKAAETSLAGKATPDSVTAQIASALSALLPTGMGPFPWSLPALPSGGWDWADGGVLLSSTPYTALRTAYINAGFPYGQDGSGNPKKPDMRGRVPAGKDDMGGTAANRITTGGSGINGATLGAAGGAETHTLTTAQMPAHNHGVTDPGHQHGNTNAAGSGGNYAAGGAGYGYPASVNTQTAYTGITTQNNGSGGSHNNTQPSLVVNYIIKT